MSHKASQQSYVEQMMGYLSLGDTEQALSFFKDVIAQYQQNTDWLNQQLWLMKKHRFGKKTEKISSEQLDIFEKNLAQTKKQDSEKDDGEDNDAGDLSEEEKIVVAQYRRTKRRKSKGKINIDGLPREIVKHELTPEQKTCPCCGIKGKVIGHEESCEVVREPTKVIFRVHQQEKIAFDCVCENRKTVITAPSPDKPIAKSIASFSLLADIITNKYQNHLPLDRQRRMMARENLIIPENTLVNWIGHAANILKPISDQIMTLALASHILQTDDTRVLVLDVETEGGSKTGRLWCYVGDKNLIAFDFTPNWSAARAQELLSKHQGPVQADAYKGYDAVFKNIELKLIEVGCWAHCRRGFVDALSKDKRAAKVIRWIKQLYKLEDLASARNYSFKERQKFREERSQPILKKMLKWLNDKKDFVPPKDPLGKAITYAINQWTALCEFIKDGRLELDNNRAERALRRIAVGRSNWIFAGSDAGGERAAILYTLIATAEAAQIDARVYIEDVMRKLVGGWKSNRLDELLPSNWKPGNEVAQS